MSRDVIGVILLFGTYYLGAGMLIPYLPLWLKDAGMTPVHIAFAVGIPAIVRVLAAPLFGYVGDNFGKRRVIRAMTALGLLAALLLSAVSGYWFILALTCITYICWQSIPLQMDGIAIGFVRRKAVAGYGVIRAFGSMAFIFSTFAGSFILTHFGSQGVVPYFIVVAVAMLLATTQIPAETDVVETRGEAAPVNVWRQPSLVSVMVAAATVHGAHAAFVSFGALHMREIGFSNVMMATIFAIATGAEILMFLCGHLVAGYLRPIQWIALGAAVALFRWTVTAFVDSPEALIALQLLHALTFSGTYMGMIAYLVETVDPRQIASAQGVYIAMFGIFNASLTLAVGLVFEQLGGRSFLLSAALPVLALIILATRALLIRTVHAGS